MNPLGKKYFLHLESKIGIIWSGQIDHKGPQKLKKTVGPFCTGGQKGRRTRGQKTPVQNGPTVCFLLNFWEHF